MVIAKCSKSLLNLFQLVRLGADDINPTHSYVSIEVGFHISTQLSVNQISDLSYANSSN